jgi:hypothetical protein
MYFDIQVVSNVIYIEVLSYVRQVLFYVREVLSYMRGITGVLIKSLARPTS